MIERYYHGTCLKGAVDQLVSGEAIFPGRPRGRSSTARSRNNLVYLTPSFNQAAEYAFMRDRSDWPSVDRSMFSDSAHVFEFGDIGTVIEPDEDELGFATKVAFCRSLGKSHEWSMNSSFATALVAREDVLKALREAAYNCLTASQYSKLLEQPQAFKGADKTRIGLRLQSGLGDELNRELIDLGISVGTCAMVRPVAAFCLPTRVMHPDDAIELWRTVPPQKAAIATTLSTPGR